MHSLFISQSLSTNSQTMQIISDRQTQTHKHIPIKLINLLSYIQGGLENSHGC